VNETKYGLLIAARRDADHDKYYWRITPWLMPWYTMIPPYGESPLRGHAWVPVDDEHCWVYNMSWHPARALTKEELAEMRAGGGIHTEMIPGTDLGKQNKANDYLIDRELQKSGLSYTGIKGLAVQDIAIQESMGPIYDRANEHLRASDTAIIAARRLLMKAAQGLDNGAIPPGVDPLSHRVRAASVMLPRGVPFQEGAKDFLVSQPGRFYVSV
jgi:hypothetical protein